MKKNNSYDQNEFIKFVIDKLQYISIEPPYKDIDSLTGYEHPSENLHWIYHGPNNLTLRIAGGCFSWIDHELDKFISHLKSALDGELELNINDFPNLGRQWNEYLHKSHKNQKAWDGKRYLCLEDINVETFIYAIDGIIYLEIIPMYPWLLGSNPKGKKKTPFKEFLKNYKPYIRTNITRKAIQQWLESAQFVRNIIDRNQQVLHELREASWSRLDNDMGQIALDRALRIDETGKMLISPNNVLSAIFYAKQIGKPSSYHGFSVNWEKEWPKLTKQSKEMLVNSLVCDQLGNVLPQTCIKKDPSPETPKHESYCPSYRITSTHDNDSDSSTANHKITLAINTSEYLYIDILYGSPESLQMCDAVGWFYQGPSNTPLSIVDPYHCIESELEGFILYLQLTLNGKRELDPKKIFNIGYQWNERLYDTEQNKEKWPGAPYLVFSTATGPETFVYTIDGTIYLEIVPTYPWLFGNKPPWMKTIPFKEFLKSYKPYVRTIITRENAEKWLATAKKLRNIIDQNQQDELAKLPTNET